VTRDYRFERKSTVNKYSICSVPSLGVVVAYEVEFSGAKYIWLNNNTDIFRWFCRVPRRSAFLHQMQNRRGQKPMRRQPSDLPEIPPNISVSGESCGKLRSQNQHKCLTTALVERLRVDIDDAA
jgi:hypothetical protein